MPPRRNRSVARKARKSRTRTSVKGVGREPPVHASRRHRKTTEAPPPKRGTRMPSANRFYRANRKLGEGANRVIPRGKRHPRRRLG